MAVRLAHAQQTLASLQPDKLGVVKQIWDFGDQRNKGWCVFCGGPEETRDHVPSKVLLDDPLPQKLPVVPACTKCNGEFSRDEAYFACLIECALTGSLESAQRRPKIGKLLARSPLLAARLAAARYQHEDQIGITPEPDRVRAMILKLARGHAAFEVNEPRTDDPLSVASSPFTAMTESERERFETGIGAGPVEVWPEVGSRAMTRAVTGDDVGPGGWITVQPEMYRYRVNWNGGLNVQIVVREYLAAEVIWE